MPKLIVGCGYLGSRVARLWREAGEQVWVLTRSPDKAAALKRDGFFPIVADLNDLRNLAPSLLPAASLFSILYSIGYDRQSPQPIHEVYAGGLARLLASPVINSAASPTCRWIYISTTGVYGSAAGDFVDEETPPQPAREGGKASLAAEQILQASPHEGRGIILRLAGLYGPGRIPRAADLQAGHPIDAPAEGWLNLIHVDDAARIVVQADQGKTPNLYCVSDGSPVQRADYYRELARLLGAPEPRFIAPPPNSPASLRAGSDKRVSPAKLFRELSPLLLYPSYREGLEAILRAENEE